MQDSISIIRLRIVVRHNINSSLLPASSQPTLIITVMYTADNIYRSIEMRYRNLTELISCSNSSRHFFLSLQIKDQTELSKYGDYIHSAAELHEHAANLEKMRHYDTISGFSHIRTIK